MKTLVCQDPGQFVWEEREQPDRSHDSVRLKVKRVCICGTDIHAFGGRQPFFTYPRVLGHELACEVVEASEDSSFKPGDLVVVMPYLNCGSCSACEKGRGNCCKNLQVLGVHRDGGMCEELVLPSQYLLPASGLDLDQCAMVEFNSIGYHAVRRADIQKNDTVLVIGAGPIGMAVIQFAKLFASRVMVMDINEERLAFCKDTLGVSDAIKAGEGAKEEMSKLTQDDFPDVVFEVTGNPASMNASFDFTAHAGKLVLVSVVKADIQFHDPELHKRELTVLSSRNATKDDFEFVIQNMRESNIKTSELITHHCSFPDLVDEFQSWIKPGSGVIKAMVNMA